MKLVYRWVCAPWLLSGAAKQGEIKWRKISKREKEERHRCRERARGESQGESHLFASEKLLNSMCGLRESALKSQPKMPWYRILLLRSSELIQSATSHTKESYRHGTRLLETSQSLHAYICVCRTQTYTYTLINTQAHTRGTCFSLKTGAWCLRAPLDPCFYWCQDGQKLLSALNS